MKKVPMRLKSLKSKLLLAVSILVISNGLLISLLVTQRYSRSLLESATAQAEYLSHAVALEATEKILTNDLVALQKMLDHQKRSNPAIGYLFVLRDNQVLAHTFPKGIPADLIKINYIPSGDQIGFTDIESTTNEHYLDIARPIIEGKGGVLRLGFLENPYRRQVTRLWLQMSAFTLLILLTALAVCLFFIKRITGPLVALAEATEKIDEDHLEIQVELKGHDEVGRLTSSFNKMINRVKDYTKRLEENAIELDRAHNQTQSCFAIVQEIGALPNLQDVGSHLISRFQELLACKEMILLILTANWDGLFVLSDRETKLLRDESIATSIDTLKGLKGRTIVSKDTIKPPIVPDSFMAAKHLSLFPFHHENQLSGAMISACPGNCPCDTKEMELLDLLLNQTSGAIKRAALQEEEIRNLQRRLEITAEFSGIIGKDPQMQMIYKLIEDIAPSNATVLIQGESGTGKELVANAIHRKSQHKDKPFVIINCSAYPITLLESEIFGHEKGAFTGAIRQKIGRFEQANGGTVFLDEIGEIPPAAQIKLLRVLQNQKFERLGGEQTLTVDLRILAATNRDLLQDVKNGHFREDLFYRLNVIPIILPPLRERRNDIPLLSRHFLYRFATEQNKNVKEFSSDAMRFFLDYSWPGNVRELENTVEHATVLCKSGRIEVTDLPQALRKPVASLLPPESSKGIIQRNEINLLRDVLEECNWNKKQAARHLGISRSTLYNKLKKYQIDKPTVH